ncbi:MAG: small ribosomal subunit biogenesis GTPase RsgA [Sedimenticola sp.]|nr:small ribosomal subunit biogenesis GTPase RsgA [Sedimenticola sp.]MCW8921794.1 small ribosomal subunit biogenesis GTPase RsgA [Sedimenticola sp.]MCW8946943.1 small ribosomal subunit biogenesis GTPase RsgA [Sedimenticola sp.]MCW8949866.1 small ribosomal subunit biogenesis GTPase RsgA [Sedimenticola sp.]MCW8975138.1 small ribosomal subunit biogenesis GTPase RsgA [Sedimenticola sp.]
MAKRRLNERQRERIHAIQERRRKKLEQHAELALSDVSENTPREGRVITRHGQNLVISDDTEHYIHCLSRQNIGQVVCGDRVVWQATDDGQGVVTAVLPRETALIRPNFSGEARALAANISQIVIVLAPEPMPSQYLVDQYLVAAEQIGVTTLIALNKRDLMDNAAIEAFDRQFGHYETIGYPVIKISAKFEHGLDPLIERLNQQTSILVGQSGVGKSSLIMALLPDIEIQIGRLSEASGLGCHTTSATTLYDLPSGGHLIDSPGVRSFRLGALTPDAVAQGFIEFGDFLGHCKFSNCSHQQEPGCALKEAVEEGKIHPQRLSNFLHMVQGLTTTH